MKKNSRGNEIKAKIEELNYPKPIYLVRNSKNYAICSCLLCGQKLTIYNADEIDKHLRKRHSYGQVQQAVQGEQLYSQLNQLYSQGSQSLDPNNLTLGQLPTGAKHICYKFLSFLSGIVYDSQRFLDSGNHGMQQLGFNGLQHAGGSGSQAQRQPMGLQTFHQNPFQYPQGGVQPYGGYDYQYGNSHHNGLY
uniref:C2H2-type domain-containing protein n=1 Tax=Meloidogyne hapla TaxID=6305 RepID=A0A1I8C0D6_MELHA